MRRALGRMETTYVRTENSFPRVSGWYMKPPCETPIGQFEFVVWGIFWDG